MTSQYETKRLITFDRIKIKSNYKYLLNTKVKFNEMFHSRSGEKIGIFYSSKDDINIPYNLYVAVSYIKQTLTLEFSSKILKEKYPLTYKYFQQYKSELENRNLHANTLWYEFGRSQGLNNSIHNSNKYRKILLCINT